MLRSENGQPACLEVPRNSAGSDLDLVDGRGRALTVIVGDLQFAFPRYALQANYPLKSSSGPAREWPWSFICPRSFSSSASSP